MPRDGYGREIDYLRLSLTDHCNLRCVYCMPESGLRFLPASDLLTAAELEQVVRAAVAVGFRKFRLTGGEPTLRADLVEIVARIRRSGVLPVVEARAAAELEQAVAAIDTLRPSPARSALHVFARSLAERRA